MPSGQNRTEAKEGTEKEKEMSTKETLQAFEEKAPRVKTYLDSFKAAREKAKEEFYLSITHCKTYTYRKEKRTC